MSLDILIEGGYKDRECLRHETYDQFRIGDGGGMVREDIVSRMPDGMLVLADWKTGRDDAENETELHMTACVLWAKEFSAMVPMRPAPSSCS